MRTSTRIANGTALLFVLSALPALACPTAVDLDGAGIRFANPQGETVTHTRLDPMRVQTDWSAGDAYVSRAILVQGVFVETLVDLTNGVVEPGSQGIYERSERPEALPLPVPGLTWTGRQVYRDRDGPVDETLDITVGDAIKVRFGDCTYDALPVTMAYRGPDGGYSENVQYFPSLGTSLLVGGRDQVGPYSYGYASVSVVGE